VIIMKNILLKIFPTFNAESGYYFLLGMFSAMVILFIICIVAVVIWLIVRKNRSVSGISITAEHGSLFISASAISDLLYSLDDSFPQLEIVRIKLIRDSNALAVQVKVYYSASSELSMLQLTEGFQTKALELLKHAFGIENISRVDLIVPKSKF